MEINHNAIAAAIDASGELVDFSALSMVPGRHAATTPVAIVSALRDGGHEARNRGPEWMQSVPALADGSPCLNAIARLDARAEAAARSPHVETVEWAKVYWGSHLIAFQQSLSLTIFPPSRGAIRKFEREAAAQPSLAIFADAEGRN